MTGVTITPILPCGGCAHEPICIIRPQLEISPAIEAGLFTPHEAVRITVEVRIECGHFLPLVDVGPQPPVVESAADYSGSIPEPQRIRPLPAAVLDAPRKRRAAKPLGPPTAACEPGCGAEMAEAALSAHRRSCEAHQATRNGRVRELPGNDGPAPLHPDSAAAVERAEREHAEFAERRTEAAREAADRTWAERHPGESRPFTENQERALAALRDTGGNVAEAARALGLGDTPARVSSVVQKLRETGRLPADVAELIARRKVELGRQA